MSYRIQSLANVLCLNMHCCFIEVFHIHNNVTLRLSNITNYNVHVLIEVTHGKLLLLDDLQ